MEGLVQGRGQIGDLQIVGQVSRARAVNCTADNVIVTAGTQQGLYMGSRVLLARGDKVWAEDPAYPGLTAVLGDLELNTHRIRVPALAPSRFSYYNFYHKVVAL